MATTLRAANQNSSATGTAISVTAPTGTVAGDVVICIVQANQQSTITDNNGTTPFVAIPSNYQPNPTNGHTMSVFARRIQSGDPTTFNFTSSVNDRWAIVVGSFQNPNLYAIFDVFPNSSTGATNRDSSGDGTAVTASITTNTDNAINIICAGWDTGAIGTITTPAGYTLIANANGGGEPIHASYKVITPAGATGTQSIVNTQFGSYITFSFAIKDIGSSPSFNSRTGRPRPFAPGIAR